MRLRNLIAALILTACAFAQDGTPTKVIDQNRTGDLPFSTSIGTGVEHVDAMGRGLSVRIPIVGLKGRGMDFDFVLRYDSKFLVVQEFTDIWGNPAARWTVERSDYIPTSTGAGWHQNTTNLTYVSQLEVCPTKRVAYTSNYIWQDSNGAKHPLALQHTSDTTCGNNDNGPDLLAEGSWANYYLNGIVTLADGTRVPGSTIPWQDSNGNQKTEPLGKDTLGRQVVTAGSGTNQLLYTVYDSNGAAQTYTVNYGNISIATNFHLGDPNTGTLIQEYSGTRSVINSIVLPNGRSYQFQYESGTYGGLTRIDLPTGGYVTYTYATCVPLDGFAFRAVATRTVHVNGQSYTWSFSGCPDVTVTDPLNNQMVYQGQDGNVGAAQFYQGAATGNPVRAYTIDYATDTGGYSNSGDPMCEGALGQTCQARGYRPIRITTTLDDGRVSKKEFDYETFTYTYHYCHQVGQPSCLNLVGTYTTSRGNVSEIREYDIGAVPGTYGQGVAGPLIRRTDKTYLHNSITNYKTYNIVNKVLTSTVYDGGGVQKAQTQYEYDSTTLTTTTGVPQHVGMSAYRGNVTKVKRWRNTDGALVTTTYNYEDTGNILSIIDPGAHPTSWSYDDSWSGTCPSPAGPAANARAFVHQVTNALGHVGTFVYFRCTGALQAATDPNSKTTSFTYDLFGRTLSKNLPDGGQTTNSYNDTPPVSVTTTTKITASANATSVAIMDDLGRVTQTQLTSDPEGTVLADTVYDALGRKASESNPYRSTLEATYGVTSYQYDVLSRVTKVIPPDGTSSSNNVTTAYAGACTTVADQAGKQRKSCTDGLGRLTQVSEDPGLLNYETDYTYDTLNNLLQVQQKGGDPNSANWRTRTFTYDSFSHLITANNPESGTICYGTWQAGNCVNGYDVDGNLVAKTAPAPNQTGSATVTTTYTYDALHRLSTRSYSDGTTLTANFAYDSPTWGVPQTNIIGRMTEAWIGTSCCIQGSAQTFGYDAVGRTVMNNQCMPDYCPPGGAPVTYSYDLAGDMTSYTNGAGVTFSQAFDAAGRLTQITSSMADAQHPGTLVTVDPSAGYYASGALHKLTLGNGLTQTAVYNNRLQPCRMNVNSSGTAFALCTDAVPSGTVQDFNYLFNLGLSNNGNLTSMVATGTQIFSRTYGYDGLNRLLSMSAPADVCSGLSWTYDPWGNRTDQTVTGGNCFTFHAAADTNNRLVGYSYDAAGNMTSDGSHTYTYDAENRIVSVDVGAATYLYDALGRRTSKRIGTSFTDYGYDLAGNPITEWKNACGGQTCWATGYVYLIGDFVAEYSAGTTYFALADHLGSTRLLTKVDQTIQDSMDYQPYGEQIGGDTGTTHKFTGKERDGESGLDYFGARYYSSTMARFTVPDPVGVWVADAAVPQSWNLYSYALNSPLTYVDPSGLEPACHWVHEGQSGGGNDWDDTPANGGAGQGECESQGGTWQEIPGPQTTVTVNGDTGQVTVESTVTFWQRFGIRARGQSWMSCMRQNSQNYSLVGAFDLTFGTNVQGTPVSILAGNDVTGLLFGSGSEKVEAIGGEGIGQAAKAGAGTAVTYGRRSAALFDINLAGKGGLPKALSSTGAKEAISKVVEYKAFADVGFTFAEVIGCTIHQ